MRASRTSSAEAVCAYARQLTDACREYIFIDSLRTRSPAGQAGGEQGHEGQPPRGRPGVDNLKEALGIVFPLPGDGRPEVAGIGRPDRKIERAAELLADSLIEAMPFAQRGLGRRHLMALAHQFVDGLRAAEAFRTGRIVAEDITVQEGDIELPGQVAGQGPSCIGHDVQAA